MHSKHNSISKSAVSLEWLKICERMFTLPFNFFACRLELWRIETAENSHVRVPMQGNWPCWASLGKSRPDSILLWLSHAFILIAFRTCCFKLKRISFESTNWFHFRGILRDATSSRTKIGESHKRFYVFMISVHAPDFLHNNFVVNNSRILFASSVKFIGNFCLSKTLFEIFCFQVCKYFYELHELEVPSSLLEGNLKLLRFNGSSNIW